MTTERRTPTEIAKGICESAVRNEIDTHGLTAYDYRELPGKLHAYMDVAPEWREMSQARRAMVERIAMRLAKSGAFYL